MEIPGYTLTSRISESDAKSVHLATSSAAPGQFVVQLHHLAEKSQDPQQCIDHLQSMRNLLHPHLPQIVDVGLVDGDMYAVMPHYSGGSLSERLRAGLSMAQLIRMTSQLCEALTALHERGRVHGDIKPSNVMFDESGSVKLIDGSYIEPTPVGNWQTRGYAAPELMDNADPTAASDIYSLGVLLFRILNGGLPWQANNGEPRARSATDSLPLLPPQHAAFQPLLERMVAFVPDERVASIEEVRRQLTAIGTTGELNTVAVKSDLISTGEIKAALPRVQDRQADSEVGVRRPRQATVVHLFVLNAIGVAGVLALGAGAYELPATKRMLSNIGILENVALVEARLNAAALVADPNQNLQSIVAAYESILVLEPEDIEAINAINATRARWKSDFEVSLARNELNIAQSRLDDLLAIYPDDLELQSMFDELQSRRHALRLQSDTLALLRVTVNDPNASAEMALHALREVVRLYPASVVASRELDKLAAYFATEASREIEREDIQAALDALGKASLANPGYVELAAVRERIQTATTLRDEIASRLQEASTLQRIGQLASPPERNAAMLFHSVLTADPDNEIALRGLGEVSNQVVAEFEAHLASREFTEIRLLVERAKTVGLYPASIMHMESTLANELESIADAADFVVLAERYISQGYITEPPDNNALEALVAAKRLDATNIQIPVLFEVCVRRLASVASDARSFDLNEVASTYIELSQQVAVAASR